MFGRRDRKSGHLLMIIFACKDNCRDRICAHEIDQMGHTAEAGLFQRGGPTGAKIMQPEGQHIGVVVTGFFQCSCNDLFDIVGNGGDR